jgi:hypothetical protein
MEKPADNSPPSKCTGDRLYPDSPFTDVKADECFGEEVVEHEIHGSVCVSRDRAFLSSKSTFIEFVRASFVLAEHAGGHSWGQPLWFVARQAIELGLKEQILGKSSKWPNGHKLEVLLQELKALDPNACCGELGEFVCLMGKHDPAGDEGRYFTKKNGACSLSAVCCIDPQKLIYFVGLMRKEVISDTDWHE